MYFENTFKLDYIAQPDYDRFKSFLKQMIQTNTEKVIPENVIFKKSR